MSASSEARKPGEAASGVEADRGAEATIVLSGDLHARPAGSLAVAAAAYTSSIELVVGDRSADAKSVLSVMGIGATSGQPVIVRACGPDAREAVKALIEILAHATQVGA